jgi:hypothetical protein
MSNKKNVNSNSDWLFLYWDEPIFSNSNNNHNADTSSEPKGDETRVHK